METRTRKTFVPELTALIKMKNERKVKKLRGRCLIHEYKTLDSFCQKLLNNVNSKSQVAICFGNADFDPARTLRQNKSIYISETLLFFALNS